MSRCAVEAFTKSDANADTHVDALAPSRKHIPLALLTVHLSLAHLDCNLSIRLKYTPRVVFRLDLASAHADYVGSVLDMTDLSGRDTAQPPEADSYARVGR